MSPSRFASPFVIFWYFLQRHHQHCQSQAWDDARIQIERLVERQQVVFGMVPVSAGSRRAEGTAGGQQAEGEGWRWALSAATAQYAQLCQTLMFVAENCFAVENAVAARCG